MLLPFFQWLDKLSFTEVLRSVDWYGAMINVAHLLALVVFFGGLLIVDLRLMGRGLKNQPLAQVAQEANPWLFGGFLGLVATGIPQLMLQPVKEYYSDIFWFKMYVLAAAIIFTLTVRRMATQADEGRLGMWGALIGLVSMALWAGVAIPARLIGLLS
jgi:uncharacterized protein DUF6644